MSTATTGDVLAEALHRQGAFVRPASVAMDPAVLGAARLTRYSFNRMLLRRAHAERWQVRRTHADLDAEGRGRSVYTATIDGNRFSFVAFTTTVDEDAHTDRVIADRWEIAAVLVDGEVNIADLAVLEAQVPLQERARFGPEVLTLTRGNRSVRFFDYVADRLAAGLQPDPADVGDAGYLMRSTAFYANGKFGMRSFDGYDQAHPLAVPYRAQFLAAWLFRELAYDVVEHIASVRGGDKAVGFDAQWRRFFGLGNATGLGLVPYAFKHPHVLHAWVAVREVALAEVRHMAPTADDLDRLAWWIQRAADHMAAGTDDDCTPFLSARELSPILESIESAFERLRSSSRPYDALYRWAADQDVETQELVVSLLVELHHERSDDEVDDMLRVDEHRTIDPATTVGELRQLIDERFGWIDQLALHTADANAYWWVVSDNTEEPRRARATVLDPAGRDVAIDIAASVWRLGERLATVADDVPMHDLLRAEPHHRAAAERVLVSDSVYGEPRDNACAAGYLPLQLQRFQLAQYGMDNFKPKSTDWLRVTLFQGAPRIDDLARPDDEIWDDRWVFPPHPTSGSKQTQ